MAASSKLPLLAVATVIIAYVFIYNYQSYELNATTEKVSLEKPRIDTNIPTEKLFWLDVQMPEKSWYYGFDPPIDLQRWRTAQLQVCALPKQIYSFIFVIAMLYIILLGD